MTSFSVTAVGTDRPGIVAALTASLFELGCNLEDVSSTILRGTFAIMLVVSAPDHLEAGTLERDVADAVADKNVAVTVRPVEVDRSGSAEATHLLSAYGSDRPGIVARLAGLLADRGANITDLTCRLVGEEAPMYVMIAEVVLPVGVDPNAVAAEIDSLAGELSVDVTFRPVEVETL